jgi:transcription initiation factor TFIIIB Brf1 subunit/transcription initiation factor TFIIB
VSNVPHASDVVCKSITCSCGVLMQVAAACLYIVCRQDEKPYMLIDFSDALQARHVPVSSCMSIKRLADLKLNTGA